MKTVSHECHRSLKTLLTISVLITTSLFWNMLEVSLGIVASCLPTLRGLFTNRSVDSVVNSIKVKLSIRSERHFGKSEDSIQLAALDGDGSQANLDFISVVSGPRGKGH